MTALLEARGIGVNYGKIVAVSDVSLSVAPGSIVTAIGPNGAGKSSLLRALVGAQPSSGEIHFMGERIDRLPMEDRIEMGLVLVPEERALFSSMSVRDNIELGAFGRRGDGSAAIDAVRREIYELFPRLKERAGQEAGTLSGGERQMLALARALMGKPRLLMLDEPSLGLAPRIVRDIFRIIIELRRRGVSLLVVEQNARAALQAADRGYVIEQGRIAMEGEAGALANDARVLATYLGGPK
ncbi:ABC transporter ATP-binding protein [Microbaculum marinisediminis]|uniref:ABC transporter ATP-binding protein n=1 Tax=Microbaculum marinisediminis TaxID=2931392 RepID=A0AAW5R4X8_9HYPH|nr:ABC transporter ATP-binding protein [Microbaculum sp. A6E488]MCT8974187.1 ABC transporter ATP-binding protein [Microbaculum sp. A6E488]